MKVSGPASLIGLLLLTVVCVIYMALGVLNIDPRISHHKIVLQLPSSGGIMSNSDVSLRGVKIGEVTGIQVARSGVNVSIEVDTRYPIPTSGTKVRVAALSLAGEQYIEIQPSSDSGPYVSDDSFVFSGDSVSVPPTVSELLASIDSLVSQVDGEDFTTIMDVALEALRGNEGNVAKLADAAYLVDHFIRDKGDALINLFTVGQQLLNNAVPYSDIVTQIGVDLPKMHTELIMLVDAMDDYRTVAGHNVFQDIINPFLDELMRSLSGSLPFLAWAVGLLNPELHELRGMGVDLGPQLSNLLSMFPADGGVRVAVKTN